MLRHGAGKRVAEMSEVGSLSVVRGTARVHTSAELRWMGRGVVLVVYAPVRGHMQVPAWVLGARMGILMSSIEIS